MLNVQENQPGRPDNLVHQSSVMLMFLVQENLPGKPDNHVHQSSVMSVLPVQNMFVSLV